MSKTALFPEPLKPGVILADTQITQLVEHASMIEPFAPQGLDSVSYDVRVGKKGIIGGQGLELDLTKTALELQPGGYAAVVSLEKVKIPDDVVVRINAKRSFSYEGIALLTGTQIDPGYEGHLLFGFYNASSRKAVLRTGRAICSLVFEALGARVNRPKSPDPALLHGNFPDSFVNQMANMDVLSWHQLSQHVKDIDRIAKDLLELRSKYENVVQPIKELTGNVERLSVDVDKLQASIRTVGEHVSDLRDLSQDNQKQIQQITSSVEKLVTEVTYVKRDTTSLGETDKKQAEKISELSRQFSVFSNTAKILWTVVILVVGAVLGALIKRYLFP